MPDMDCFWLYQEIKKIDSRVKVCFLTAREIYYERFRKEKGFCALDKDLFVRKLIANKGLIKK
jgi:two-component system catabolic regulation response regulator CreB/two-component system response regulator ChvI